MQKIHNYGSFLQAFSLKNEFERRGHEVYFIDILPGREIVKDETKRDIIWHLKKIDLQIFKCLNNYVFSRKMDKVHIDDYNRYLEVKKKLPEKEMFDLAVIGSDEVFNATAPSSWGVTTQLFGDIRNAKKVVSYAASCGSTTYAKAASLEIIDEIKPALCSMEQISVRDRNTFDFVKAITGREPYIHVDPVFLANYDDYIPDIMRRKPYLLVYAYGNRIHEASEINAIFDYAESHGLEVISVGMQQKWCKHNIIADAWTLLAYIRNAESIVTDTFHGTVFSIKYHKPFVTLIRDSNRNKLLGLLEQFDLLSRTINNIEDLKQVLDSEIDFSASDLLISREICKANSYIDMVLNGVK